MGLFKVTPLQKTTFFLNSPKTPTAEASLSLSLSLLFSSSLSSALYIKLPTRFCLNEQKSQKIKKNAEYRQATSPPSKTILFSETGWFVLRAAAVSSQYKINVGRVGFMGLFITTFTRNIFSYSRNSFKDLCLKELNNVGAIYWLLGAKGGVKTKISHVTGRTQDNCVLCEAAESQGCCTGNNYPWLELPFFRQTLLISDILICQSDTFAFIMVILNS